MVGELYAGISSFKVMLDIVKGLKDLSTASAREAASVELLEKLVTAYHSQLALEQRMGDLEKEIAAFKDWETEKERYALTDYGSGTFAYALKPAMANGEPAHRICAHCYGQGHKTLLQFVMSTRSQERLHCARCKADIFLGTYRTPEPTAY
jgi:hypothetical protein